MSLDGNYVCNIQVEKFDRTIRPDGSKREESIIVSCAFTVPVDEIGVVLMKQHLLDAHGITVGVAGKAG